MIYSDTLVIRHLSNALSQLEKEDFLKHFGASHVKCVTSQCRKYNLVFAKFPSTSVALSALQRLHQLEVLGVPLTVEYARQKENFSTSSEKCTISRDKETKNALKKKHKEFVQKLNAWHQHLQPTRPPPYHLRYAYPPVTIEVLTNICRSIAMVPKLYTQVLHLMNRMNMPCPFGPLFPGPEIFVVSKQPTDDQAASIGEDEDMEESEESEMESAAEEGMGLSSEIIPQLPVKRARAQGRPKVKRRRTLAGGGRAAMPSNRAPMLPEEMFEREAPVVMQPKKIELNIAVQPPGQSTEVKDQGDEEQLPGFGILPPVKKDGSEEESGNDGEEASVPSGAISLRELRYNRISTKDQKLLPVFKNYQTGAPSCRLYVKNVSKQVEAKDLHYIYSSFLNVKDEEESKMFDIRLMQEGRMKGQAFITLPSVPQAKAALEETNGYILKGKPLVVQYARSAKPK